MSTLKSRNFRNTTRTLVTSSDELRDFEAMTREQEAEWWETHDVAEELFDEGPEIDAEVCEALGIPDPKPKSRNPTPSNLRTIPPPRMIM